jgi:hypothetical protein
LQVLRESPEHVEVGVGQPDLGWQDLLGRLVHDTEEHPQVVGGSEHRFRPAPSRKELQLGVDQRHADAHHRLPERPSRTDQTGIEH